MAIASIMIMACYLSKRDRQDNFPLFFRKTAYTAFALLITVQLYGEINLRYTRIFWEPGIQQQTVLGESGPEKGILMTPERMQNYQIHENDIAIIRDAEGIQKVLFLSENTYLYLSAQKEYATYSAWLSGVTPQTIERLDRYYELFPEKIPDGIYIEAEYSEYAKHFLSNGYVADELPSRALWLTRLPSSRNPTSMEQWAIMCAETYWRLLALDQSCL